MDKNDQKENKKVKVIIIVLVLLLIGSCSFIIYDKFIKNEAILDECYCPECKKCDSEEEMEDSEEETTVKEEKEYEEDEYKLCLLDMKGKTKLDVYSLCEKQGISNVSKVKIKNVTINKKNYVLYHEFVPFYDSKGTYVNYNGITKLYLNGFLLDVYKGQNRETLWTVQIDGNNLIVSETWPSENPPVNYKYNLDKFNYEGFTFDLHELT